MAVAAYAFMHHIDVQGDRTAMAFLPLAHIYEVRPSLLSPSPKHHV